MPKHFIVMTTKRFPADAIIIGFTGSICSGCSEFARWLEREKGYEYFSLSSPIQEIILKKIYINQYYCQF